MSLRRLRFPLRTFLLWCTAIGCLSGLFASHLFSVIRVYADVRWLEQHGVHVWSDFKDRYGLFPPDRKTVSQAVFEWSVASPCEISAALAESSYVNGIVKRLATLPAIRSLNLAAVEISSEDLEELRELSDLEELSLSATKLDDSALDTLQTFSHLRKLDLSETEITDASLKQIASMQSLRSIALDHTQVTRRGLRALSHARPDLIVTPKSSHSRAKVHRKHSGRVHS
jgi:hypothetical protein